MQQSLRDISLPSSWQLSKVTTLGAVAVAAGITLQQLTQKKSHHLSEKDVIDIESLVRTSLGEYAIQFFPHFTKKNNIKREIIYPVLSTNRVHIHADRAMTDALNVWLAGAENYLEKRSLLRMKWAKSNDKHAGIVQGFINYVIINTPVWFYLALENKINLTLDNEEKNYLSDNPLLGIKRFFSALLNDSENKEKLYVIADLKHIVDNFILPRLRRKLSQQNCSYRLGAINNHLENIWRDLLALVVFLSDETIAKINPDLRLIIPEQVQNGIVHAQLGEARGIKTVLNFFPLKHKNDGDYLINELKLSNAWAKKIMQIAKICLSPTVKAISIEKPEYYLTEQYFDCFHPILKQKLLLKTQKSRNFSLQLILDQKEKIKQIQLFDSLFPLIAEISQLEKTIQYLRLLTGWVGDKNIYTALKPIMDEVLYVALPETCEPLLNLLREKNLLGKIRVISENAYLNKHLRTSIGIRTQMNVIGECIGSIKASLLKLKAQAHQIRWHKNNIMAMEEDMQKVEIKLVSSIITLRKNQLTRQKSTCISQKLEMLQKKLTITFDKFYQRPVPLNVGLETEKNITQFIEIINTITHAFSDRQFSQTLLFKYLQKLFSNTTIKIFSSAGRTHYPVDDLFDLQRVNLKRIDNKCGDSITRHIKVWQSIHIACFRLDPCITFPTLNKNILKWRLKNHSMINLALVTPKFKREFKTIQFLKKKITQLEKITDALASDHNTISIFAINLSLIDHYLRLFSTIANSRPLKTNFISDLKTFCQRCRIDFNLTQTKGHQTTISLTLKDKNKDTLEQLIQGIQYELNEDTAHLFNHYINWIGHESVICLIDSIIFAVKNIINPPNSLEKKRIMLNTPNENIKTQLAINENHKLKTEILQTASLPKKQSTLKKKETIQICCLLLSLIEINAAAYCGINHKYILSFSLAGLGTMTLLATIFSYILNKKNVASSIENLYSP